MPQLVGQGLYNEVEAIAEAMMKSKADTLSFSNDWELKVS